MGGVAWGLQSGTALLAPVGLALAAWLILGVLVDLGERVAVGRVPPAQSLRRLGRLPRADWGKTIAHAGVGITAAGIAAITAWEVEDIRLAEPGDTIPLGGYELAFDDVIELPLGAPFAVPGCGRGHEAALKGGEPRNFTSEVGRFRLLDAGETVAVLCPEKRVYPVQSQPTTEAAIDPSLWRDVYVVLGDRQTDGDAWAVRSYVKPLAVWIWLGALVMALGGAVSLTDRRYRVGAVAKRRAAPVPAE